MAKHTVALAANTGAGGVKICNVVRNRNLQEWRGLLMAYGTFGSGTVAWYISPDNGTTLIAMTDLTDAAITMTTAKAYDSSLTTGSKNTDKISIWVVLSGATSPALNIVVYDNN